MIDDYNREVPKFSIALRKLCDARVSVRSYNNTTKRLYELLREVDEMTRSPFLDIDAEVTLAEITLEALIDFIDESRRLKQDPEDRWFDLLSETIKRFCESNPRVPVEAWFHLHPDPRTNDCYRMALLDFLNISEQVVAEEFSQPAPDFTDDSSESLDKFFKELEMITV